MPTDPNTGQPLPYPPGAGAGAPPAPGGGGQTMEMPPEIARHIDPNNQMQMTLLQRVDKLTDVDGQALMQGISPAAAAVLKKIIPELGFAIDMLHEGGGAMPGSPAPGGAPMPGGGQPPQFSQPRPQTKLGGV